MTKKSKRKAIVIAIVIMAEIAFTALLVWSASQRPYYRPEFLSHSVSEGR